MPATAPEDDRQKRSEVAGTALALTSRQLSEYGVGYVGIDFGYSILSRDRRDPRPMVDRANFATARFHVVRKLVLLKTEGCIQTEERSRGSDF